MAFDITKPAQDTLTPEEKTWFDQQLSTASEAAVTKFKTDADEARRKAVPEKYELKFSDQTPLDSKTDAEKIAAFARQQGFTAEQAAALVKQHEELAGGVVARQQQFLTDQAAKWKTEVESDKDLGGANLPVTQANLKRVMDRFAPGDQHALREILNTTGYGNHPVWVRFVNAIGKAMAEDTSGGGNGLSRDTKTKTLAQRMFPDLPSAEA
jgi:hypothetical protein